MTEQSVLRLCCWGLALLCPVSFASSLMADPPPPAATLEEIRSQFPAGRPDSRQAESIDSADGAGAKLEEGELAVLLDSLGAPQFAVRERAAGKIRLLGPRILPALRQRARNSADPEIRTRATELAEQISRSDLEERVAAFLEGTDVGFEGWEVVRGIFGESLPSRELFVELRDAHPELVVALGGTPKQREQALEDAMLKVQRGIFVQRVLPTRADVLAMLLPANDVNVTVTKPVETLVLRTLAMPSGRELLSDPQVGSTASKLLVGFFQRTSLTIRADVLWIAMELEVDEVVPIAVETLGQSDQPVVLTQALQAIAQFGSRRELPAVAALFDNRQVVVERGLALDDQAQTTVADAALATAAILLEVPMTEVGFPASAEHDRFGFLPDDIGIDASDDELRKKIRREIERRIQGR